MGRREELATEVRRLMRRWWSEPDEPPTPDELLAYRDGELAPRDQSRIAAKIERDPAARGALDALRSFPDVPPLPGGESLTEAEVEADWRRLQERLTSARGASAPDAVVARAPAAPHPPASPPPAGRRFRPAGGRWRLAAAVAVLAAGLAGWWIGRSHPGEPSTSVVVMNLAPVGSVVRRSAAPPAGGEIATAERLVLSLVSAEPPRPGAYGVTIASDDGRRLWSTRDARPDRSGIVRVDLPADFLPPGRYRIEVAPSGGGVPAGYDLDIPPP